MKGTIKTKTPKGFGFIAPEGAGSDDKGIFFHSSNVVGTTFDELSEGQSVTYDMGEDTGKGPAAVNVQAA